MCKSASFCPLNQNIKIEYFLLKMIIVITEEHEHQEVNNYMKNSKPLVSVIVPIYNVEKYLSKCIDSILGQTYTNFELILVEDGSPDRCYEICERYALKDKRILVMVHWEEWEKLLAI